MVAELALFVVSLALVSGAQDSSPPATPLSRASQRPLNVDPKLDCALKQLAADYAKMQLKDMVCS